MIVSIEQAVAGRAICKIYVAVQLAYSDSFGASILLSEQANE